VHVLPIVLSAVAALAVAPGLRAGLEAGGHTVTNYRGAAIPCPLGIIIVAASALTIGALAALHQLGATDRFVIVAPAFVLGVAALGLFDDAYSGPSRGWRGHGGAVAAGQFPTGLLKAVGTHGLAADASDELLFARDTGQFLLEVLVLVLATNLFNIIDLRPGRAVKAYVLLLAGLLIAEGLDLLEAVGAYTGAILVAGAYDLRERGMLGDTGANLVGAAAGVALVLTISSTTGLAIAAAVLAAITAYGEFRSISALVDRAPGLRHLDSIGRIHHRE
jgi:UDP-N-acetylmuramyl pentapeptide phosphotransferase/UDP-N-acetylglucosamine-1-phosphate transferase